jgi:hypothetical protein
MRLEMIILRSAHARTATHVSYLQCSWRRAVRGSQKTIYRQGWERLSFCISSTSFCRVSTFLKVTYFTVGRERHHPCVDGGDATAVHRVPYKFWRNNRCQRSAERWSVASSTFPPPHVCFRGRRKTPSQSLAGDCKAGLHVLQCRRDAGYGEKKR